VSLEASASLHDRFRGKGSFRQVFKGVEAGLDAGLDIIVFTLVCRSSLSVLPRFADDLLARFPDIQYVTLNRMRPPRIRRPALMKEYLLPGEFLELMRVVSLMNAIGRKVALLDDPLGNVVADMLKMPSVPESKALDSWGALMVLADLKLAPSHTRNAYCGVYTPGAIENRWSNIRYLKAMAPDESMCPGCRHIHTCRANGLERPVGICAAGRDAALFCKAVLALASPP
jgi:MoaA/NifB/PqqE/SkfB family radical SAM enzyme